MTPERLLLGPAGRLAMRKEGPLQPCSGTQRFSRPWFSSRAAPVLGAALGVAAGICNTAQARECVLPNGQRFSIDVVACAQFAPGAVDVVSPLELKPPPLDSPKPRASGAADTENPPAGLIHVRGTRDSCYSIDAEGLTRPADPSRCVDR